MGAEHKFQALGVNCFKKQIAITIECDRIINSSLKPAKEIQAFNIHIGTSNRIAKLLSN
jgi:hypothetical protein